jgi:feruloyl esterase
MIRHSGICLFLWLLASFLSASVPANAQQSCESLKSVRMQNVTLTSAVAITPPWEIPPTSGMFGTPKGQMVNVSFCRVEGFSTPTSDARIGFEVWLPLAEEWNGKLLAVGNPGFIGGVSRGALSDIVQKRYVAVSTDTGMPRWIPPGAGHPEKLVDWAIGRS